MIMDGFVKKKAGCSSEITLWHGQCSFQPVPEITSTHSIKSALTEATRRLFVSQILRDRGPHATWTHRFLSSLCREKFRAMVVMVYPPPHPVAVGLDLHVAF